MQIHLHPRRSPAQTVLLAIAALAGVVNMLLPHRLAHPANLVLLAVLTGVAAVLAHRRLPGSRRR